MFAADLLDRDADLGLPKKTTIFFFAGFFVLMSIILRVGGVVGKMTGTVYGEQVTDTNLNSARNCDKLSIYKPGSGYCSR